MATGPGDERAAAARGHLRASHADRDQVIETLKAAFVQGRLDRGEFGLRVGQAFASRTYADLAVLIADLPAGLAAPRPPGPARTQDEIMQRPGRMMAAATALCAGVWAFVFLVPWPTNSEGDPPSPLIYLFFLSNLIYLLALFVGVVNAIALWREKRSGGQSPRRPATGAGGQAARHAPSAGHSGQLPPADHGHQHTAEAARRRHPRRSLRRWCPARVPG